MIKYSWKKLLSCAGRSSNQIVIAFKAHASKKPPKNKFDPIYVYYYKDFSGDSFLANELELLDNSFRWSNKEIAQYIGLASYRNYVNYTISKDASLSLFHNPISLDIINNNRLLKVKDDRIYFYYEEVANRRLKLWD